jgi:hypothetical protein
VRRIDEPQMLGSPLWTLRDPTKRLDDTEHGRELHHGSPRAPRACELELFQHSSHQPAHLATTGFRKLLDNEAMLDVLGRRLKMRRTLRAA